MNIKLGCSTRIIIFAIVLFGITRVGTDALTTHPVDVPSSTTSPQVSGTDNPSDKDFSKGIFPPFPGTPPRINLRVNYGHDWVEIFYEAGHTVWVTLTGSDGQTVKATNQATTAPRNAWGGEPGFQTTESPWLDAAGNLMQNPPDIQPGDWVLARVDNGASAKVQIGSIRGQVSSDKDSVSGTILTPWLSGPVEVECLDWSSTKTPTASKKYGGFILADGSEPYSCSWDPAEWDVLPWQDIGVGYFTPDGHWVANAFRDERWGAFWTGDLNPGAWHAGEHRYSFHMSYTLPQPGEWTSPAQTLSVSAEAPRYPGKVLLQVAASAPRIAWTGNACEVVPAIRPAQATRFVWGWINDRSMTYEEALAHFSSITVIAIWDGDAGSSTPLAMGELLPWKSNDPLWDYRCSLTEHDIK